MLVGKFNRTHSYEKVTQTYVTLVTMKKMGLIGSEISKKRKNSTKHRPSYLWGGGSEWSITILIAERCGHRQTDLLQLGK